MPDYETALGRIHDHSDAIVQDTRGILREIIKDACKAISAAEGSILIPTSSREKLKFLVSLNPKLDDSDYTFDCDGSVSGFVFNTSQAIAKIRPENDAVNKVDDLAKVDTEFLLAIPIVDEDRIYGVATFVNRVGDLSETPFSAEDMMTAQTFGEIYATGLKFYQQVELSAELARADAAENAQDFGICEVSEDGDVRCDDGRENLRISARIADIVSGLEPTERRLILGIAGLVSHHSLSEGDLTDHEF